MECSNSVLIPEAIFIILAIYISLELSGRCLNPFIASWVAARQLQARQENLKWLTQILALSQEKTDFDPTTFGDLERGSRPPGFTARL
jgi:hypothetical protein